MLENKQPTEAVSAPSKTLDFGALTDNQKACEWSKRVESTRLRKESMMQISSRVWTKFNAWKKA
jgi:hypothetical protein